MNTVYAIVTFGTPRAKVPAFTRSLDKARAAAMAAKGTGTCSNARVVKCASVAEAKAASIADNYPVVFEA